MTIQAPPTGMLVKCTLNLAPSLSISTLYSLQLCYTEIFIQGTDNSTIILIDVNNILLIFRNEGPINWSNVLTYGFQFLTIVYSSTLLFAELQFPSSFQ